MGQPFRFLNADKVNTELQTTCQDMNLKFKWCFFIRIPKYLPVAHAEQTYNLFKTVKCFELLYHEGFQIVFFGIVLGF